MEQLMTGYEWGVFLNERILNMGAYTSKDGESQADYISVIEDLYFTKEISLDEYRNNTTYCNIFFNNQRCHSPVSLVSELIKKSLSQFHLAILNYHIIFRLIFQQMRQWPTMAFSAHG